MFGFKNKTIEKQKQLIAEIETQVTQQNQLYRALYDMLTTGMPLGKDSKMKEYVKEGYEGNPDLFSIIVKLSGMFAAVPLNLREIKSDGKEVEVQDEQVNRLMTRTNYYQSWDEFKRLWAVFRYVTGNSVVYAPKFEGGVNKGKINQDGLMLMPSQNIIIRSQGWRKPLGYYELDIDESYKIKSQDVWHERFTPTLRYEDGANFMGMSPVKVAANIINAQNKGYEITAKMYANGHPPGILSKEDDDSGTLKDQEAAFRDRYKTKYQGVSNMTVPIFTLGKLKYTKIGFENMKELEIIQMSEHGRRIFANLLQVPSVLFNDPQSSIYNNMNVASKAIYTNRIMPDINSFCSGFNELLKAYGNYVLRPDYSDVEALQENKKEKSEWLSKGVGIGAYTRNEFREKLGDEKVEGVPEMDQYFIPANIMPISMDLGEENERVAESNEFYQNNNINQKL